MAPLARRPSLCVEGGCTCCTWCLNLVYDQIATTAEAEQHVRAHRSECTFNPVVMEEREHRRWQGEAWRAYRATKSKPVQAPLGRRPCLYVEGGCTWQTTTCDQINHHNRGHGGSH